MPIIQAPIVEFQCAGCLQPVRIVGDQAVICCGQRYRLEVWIHQQSQAEYEAWQAEIARQLACGNAGQPLDPLPPVPSALRYPTA